MDPEVSGSITLTAGKTDFYNLLVEKLTGVSPVLTFGSSYQLSIRNDFTMLADSKSDLNVVLGNFIDRATASTGKGTISMRNLYTSGSTVRLDTAGYDIETDNIEMTSANLALTEIVANASTITINKNWSLDAHATFTFDTSTVHLTSSETALVYGTITFKNLTIDNATAKAVYFYATGGTPTFTVGSVFTVTGHTSQLIKLYSSLPGTQWDFLPTAIATVDYADVKDGGCHAGAISIFPTNSVDSGNNGTCWGFAGGSVSGTVYLADETTPATTGNGGDCDGSTANVELRVNGGSPYTTTCSASDGTYTLSGLAASSGSYIAVYLTGTHKANAIYTTGGGADTGINLYYTVVTLSYSPSYSTIQIADMASYDSSTDATNMLFDATGTPSLTVNSSVTLQVDGGAGAEQFILDGNVTINHNLTNNGGIINPNGFTITGSGTNTLTNTNAGGAIYVDATTWAGNYASFETVTMAGNSFTYYNRIGAQTIDNSINYGVLYCAGSGTKSLGGGLTVQSYIGVSSGATVDTTGSNYSITAGFIQFYGGTFNANGSTITLTLSILSLSGGGTFNSGTSTVVMNYNNDQSITDTTTTFYNLTLSPTLTSVHTYTFGGPGTITINNNFTINPTSAGANALLVNMGGTITVAGTTTLTRTSNAVSILDTRPSGVDYDLTTGNLNIAAGGTLDASSSTSLITLNGTSGTLFTLNASGTFTPGTSVVQMTSDASVTLTSGAITFYNLYLNPTITASRAYTFGSGTLTINFAFNIQPNAASAFVLTVNMGGTINQSTNGVGLSRLGSATTTFNTNNNTLTSLSLLINSSSIFNAGSSTITLNGTTGSLIYTNSVGTGTFNPNTSTVIMNPNASLTLTSGTVAFYNLTLSPTITTARTYTFGSGVSTIGGNLNINPTSSGANALTVNMANALAITGTTTIQRTTSATANLDTISGSNYALTSGNLDIETGGTLTAQASALTLNGTSGTLFTLNGGTFTVGTSTMTISSNASVTLTSGAITFNALTLSPTITTARTYTFGSGALTINGNFGINPVSSGANLLTVNMGAAITVDITHGTSITATTSATSKLDTTGSNYALTSGYISMANSGTLVGNASTITVTSSAGASAIFDLQGTGVIFLPLSLQVQLRFIIFLLYLLSLPQKHIRSAPVLSL